jgi:hypothetical protein
MTFLGLGTDTAPVAANMNDDAPVAATLLLLLPLFVLLLAPTRDCCIASISPRDIAVLYGMF